MLADARAVQEAGAFAVVLEMVTAEIAKQVTEELAIPTIGIGAGPDTDAQVLVWQDMAGLNTGKAPRFVKRYADLAGVLADAARRYAEEVRTGAFPRRSTLITERRGSPPLRPETSGSSGEWGRVSHIGSPGPTTGSLEGCRRRRMPAPVQVAVSCSAVPSTPT